MPLLIVALLVPLAGIALAVTLPAAIGRSSGFAAVVCAGGCGFSAGAAALNGGRVLAWTSTAPYVDLRLDPLAGAFLCIIGAVAMLSGIYALGGKSDDERRSGRTAASAACLIVLASLLTCTAGNVVLVLFAWELLALGFFWAVTFAGEVHGAARAGYFTLVVTHGAGMALVIGLFSLARVAGSFDIGAVTSAGSALGMASRCTVFVLLLIGFGAKFGLPPMYAWLRYAYRSAPSVVTALMAGGALNVGFYGIARFVVPLGGVLPAWTAVLVLALGAIAAVYGISLAVGERDMRTLAAYSSVENGGIILAAFGVALAGRIAGNDTLFGLGIAAAFLQIVAHALAKSTLYLVCASVHDRAGSTSFERLGGLSRRMPLTSLTGIFAALSLAALPPLAGFAGEWMVLESMMQAFRVGDVALQTMLALAGAAIGFAASIAVVAFVKLAGVALLGAPRSPQAVAATETPRLFSRASLALGILCIAAAGLGCRSIVALLAPAIDMYGARDTAQSIIHATPLIQPAFAGFSSASPLGLGVTIAAFAAIFWLLARLVPRPRSTRVSPWASGEPYAPWMQYSGTGFANPTRVVLDAMTRTVRDLAQDTYDSRSHPYFGIDWYERIGRAFLRVADLVRKTQSGVIAAYLAYILGFLILLLVAYPSLRHW